VYTVCGAVVDGQGCEPEILTYDNNKFGTSCATAILVQQETPDYSSPNEATTAQADAGLLDEYPARS
jgi:hypothetical protein